MNEIPVSDAPITTILEFLRILGSLSNLLVEKQSANGDSFSSNGSLSAPSYGVPFSSSISSCLGSNLSWSHFRWRKCGNRLERTWTSSWKIVGIIVLSIISKYKQVLPESLRSSFNMNLVDF